MIGICPTILFGVSQERLWLRIVIFKGFIVADKSMIGIKRFFGLSELLREKADMGEKRFISMCPLSRAGVILTVVLGVVVLGSRRKKRSSPEVDQQEISDENVIFHKKF